MRPTSLIGYGRFHLELLQPGEEFARHDGSIGRVCPEQPYQQPSSFCNHPYLPDHFWVWIEVDTSNARRVFLHRHAIVHAVTRAQARTLTARSKRTKGGS